MMTESAFTRKLLKALRSNVTLRSGIVWKLNDNFTKGIPDVLIYWNGFTTYFELKVWPNTPSKIQAYYLKKLAPRAHVVTLLKSNEIVFDYHFSCTFDFNECVREIAWKCTQ